MKYLVFFVGIIISSAILLISFLDGFRLADFIIYDQFVRLTPEIRRYSSDILLIKAEDIQNGKDDKIWMDLIDTLVPMQPKLILFTFLPKQANREFFLSANTYSNVLFGRRIIQNHTGKNQFSLEPLPYGLEKKDLPHGIIALPKSYHGIHRYQKLFFSIDGERYPSLENQALKQLLGKTAKPSPAPYLVNFNGKFNGLPALSLKRVLSKEIVPRLIKGKIILIGAKETGNNYGIYTPITPNKGMSRLEFHGYSFDTLITGEAIRELDASMKISIISALVFISLVTYQIISIRLFLWVTVPLTGGYLLATWLLFSFFLIWLPPAEILAAHFLTVYFVYRRRSLQQEQTTQQMLIDTTVRLRERLLPESFYDSSDHWTQVITLVNHTLDLSRTIFLERVTGDHRVKEIKSLNCSLSDIKERRRDYHRTPYTTAIDEEKAIKIDKFPFLKKAPFEEEQYLVPLSFGGEILGFWAFGIEPSKRSTLDNFHSIVMDFANQIGGLLYRRKYKRANETPENKKLLRLLSLKGSDSAYNDLNKSISLLERHHHLIELVFHRMSMATILYDLFGRVVYVNNKMVQLLKHSDLLPFEMTAVDFTEKVTNLSLGKIRHTMQQLIYKNEPISLPAKLPAEPEKSFSLHISPLVYEKKEVIQEEEGHPFQILGILFELVEITEMKLLDRIKEDFLDHVKFQLRRDFAPILLSCSLLEKEYLPQGHREKALTIFKERLDKAFTFLKHAHNGLHEDPSIGEEEGHYPTNPTQAIQSALNILKPVAESKKIMFNVEMPELTSLVRSEPGMLADVLKTIVEILVNDAVEGSQIIIQLSEAQDSILFHLSNTGFGLPDSVFQQYLFHDSEIVSNEFRNLRMAIRQIQKWGGETKASSEVGEGINFCISFLTGQQHF